MGNEKILCIHHANCADGFTAAWVVTKRFGRENVDLHAATHGEPPPDVKGRRVVVVDFSYDRDTTRRLISESSQFTLLDHHKTAVEALGPSSDGLTLMDECSLRPDLVNMQGQQLPVMVLDVSRSGARIAWDFYFPGTQVPTLVAYVEDRDLWKFSLPRAREASSLVFSYRYDLDEWDSLDEKLQSDPNALSEGEAILRRFEKDVAEVSAASAVDMNVAGYIVPVVNVPYTMGSDACNALAKGRPFSAYYWDGPGGRTFGLRSAPDGLDVSVIAGLFGGGGHKHAAGFRLRRGSGHVRLMDSAPASDIPQLPWLVHDPYRGWVDHSGKVHEPANVQA